MRRRDQWIEWMRAVLREDETAAYAVELLDEQLHRDPSSLRHRGLEYQDYQAFQKHRQDTYLIHLFAVFESGLREAWEIALGRDTNPKMADLLQAVAARQKTTDDVLSNADRVRNYRNGLVHVSTESSETLTLQEARRYLCRFFSQLPPDW